MGEPKRDAESHEQNITTPEFPVKSMKDALLSILNSERTGHVLIYIGNINKKSLDAALKEMVGFQIIRLEEVGQVTQDKIGDDNKLILMGSAITPELLENPAFQTFVRDRSHTDSRKKLILLVNQPVSHDVFTTDVHMPWFNGPFERNQYFSLDVDPDGTIHSVSQHIATAYDEKGKRFYQSIPTRLKTFSST